MFTASPLGYSGRFALRTFSPRRLLTASYSRSSTLATPLSAMSLDIGSVLPLANSKYKIPKIGFGVYQSPPSTCVKSCSKALEAGYRHIDTAQYYANEKEVGRAREESGLPRSELYLTSKVLNPAEDVESTYREIADSVEKLDGPDGYADLFLIHHPNGGSKARRIMWQALELAKERNKVRDIGVSNFGIQQIEEIKSIGKTWPPVVNQIEAFTPPYYMSIGRLTRCSFILGANSAKSSNTVRRTTSSSKPTAPSSATRSHRTRHCSASARNTTWGRTRYSCGGVCRRDMYLCRRAIRLPESSVTLMCTASSSMQRTWVSWMDSTRARKVPSCIPSVMSRRLVRTREF